MQADYTTQKKAVGVAALGLVLQGSMGVVLLLYGLPQTGRDHPAMTAAVFALIGVFAWLALLIVSDQHRRERLEAMEAEAMEASGAAASSAFETAGAEFRVAHKRLLGLYRFFMPGTSILIALALGYLGWVRLSGGREIWQSSMPEVHPGYGWGIALGLSCAVTGFVFGRFVAGMARQDAWKHLRAGADFAVGTALVGMGLAVAHFIDLAGPDWAYRYLHLVIPGLMLVLAAEILLNFLLDLYRPRKTGVFPRPAFDSRLLAFVSAPDVVARSIGEALSYQFGYDVTRNWFYQLMSRYIGPLAAVAALVLWGMSALAVIDPHQRALITRFGSVQREVGPGLHLKMPWPIDRVEVPVYQQVDERGRVTGSVRTTTGARTLQLASPAPGIDRIILWTNEHAGDEIFFIVGPPAGNDGQERTGGDIAVVAAEVPLRFRIKDVAAYDRLAGTEGMRTSLLRGVAQRALLRHLAPLTVDDLLGARRLTLQTELRDRIQSAFDGLNGGSGIEVVSVELKGVHPPKDVAPAYERVLEAQQKQQALVLAAQAEAIMTLTGVVGSVDLARQIAAEAERLRLLPADAEGERTDQQIKVQRLVEQAGGQAAAALADARAQRWGTLLDARSRAARYGGHLASYNAAPEVYMASLYFQALKDAMADSRVYIAPEKARFIWRLEDRETGVDVFNPGTTSSR